MDNLEKISYLPNGQWQLEKGVMRRLAPKPDPKQVDDVGGGSGSQYRALSDESHRKRAAFRLLKDMYTRDPNTVKMVDGVPHIMLHRGLNDSNWKPDEMHDDHVIHHDKTTIHGEELPGGTAYTTQHNWADGHGDPLSIWVPIDSIGNYSNYNWRMASQSKFRNEDQDIDSDEFKEWGELVNIPLQEHEQPGKFKFHEDVHAFVGPGKFLRATPEEVARTKQKEIKSDPSDIPQDLKIQPRQK